MVIIGGHFERMWIIFHFNVPIPPQLISFIRVLVSSCFLLWVLDTICMFVIIYTTLIWYLLIIFIDYIEVWCRWPVAFRGSWILKMPEIIIVGFLLKFSFVWLQPSSISHIVSIVTCLCISFDILVLKESYDTLLINVMAKKKAPPCPTVSLRFKFDMNSL